MTPYKKENFDEDFCDIFKYVSFIEQNILKNSTTHAFSFLSNLLKLPLRFSFLRLKLPNFRVPFF